MDQTAIDEIDEALRGWRQGDCALGEYWFAFRFDPKRPITKASREIQQESENMVDLIDVEVAGFVVLTQTCDIVRSCALRPFLEVAPLVAVDRIVAQEVEKGLRPQYATVPGVADKGFIADLDRVMTVEKAVVAGWERIPGCLHVAQTRKLGQALARKRVRFAFPDDFVQFSKKLQHRLRDKHHKTSKEGDALRALREIRVRAAPSWTSKEVEVFFWFIRDEESAVDFAGKGWDEWLEGWIGLLPDSNRYKVSGIVTTLEDMTARDYVDSDPLDLDHLSGWENEGN